MAFQGLAQRCGSCCTWMMSARHLNEVMLPSLVLPITMLAYISFATGDASVVQSHPSWDIPAYLLLVSTLTHASRIAGRMADHLHQRYKKEFVREDTFFENYSRASGLREKSKLFSFALLDVAAMGVGITVACFWADWLISSDYPIEGVSDAAVWQDTYCFVLYGLEVALGAYVGFLMPWVISEEAALYDKDFPEQARGWCCGLFGGNPSDYQRQAMGAGVQDYSRFAGDAEMTGVDPAATLASTYTI